MASSLSSSTMLLFLLALISATFAKDISITESTTTDSVIPLRSEHEIAELYENWLIHNKKTYNMMGEKEMRYNIFKDNLKYIDESNAKKGRTFKLGLNVFADLTNKEYNLKYLGMNMNQNNSRNVSDRYSCKKRSCGNLPGNFDWRTRGVVSPVKDQAKCGGCWAFSTIAAVEGINKIATGKMVRLSEQELIDCDKASNKGCDGGWMDDAFKFIIANGGIDSEADYPYRGNDGVCNQSKRKNNVVTISGFEDVPQNNENALKNAVAHQPVSVAIIAGARDFQHYQSGVFNGECGFIFPNHAVTAIGYGTDKGQDYWLVKNSWGTNWGEKGYMRLKRNYSIASGMCGIAMQPSYPVKKGRRVSFNEDEVSNFV